MGFFSGICGAIGGAIGGICSAIGGAVGAIGGALSAGLSLLSAPVVAVVGALVCGVAAIFGLKNEEEKPEETGLRASKCDLKPEDFDSYKEYIDHLKTVDLTKEDLEELKDPQKKAEYQLAGAAIYMAGINEEYGREIPIEAWTGMATLGIKDGENAKAVLDTFALEKVEPNIKGAMDNKINFEEKTKVFETLEKSLGKMKETEDTDVKKISEELNRMLEEL